MRSLVVAVALGVLVGTAAQAGEAGQAECPSVGSVEQLAGPLDPPDPAPEAIGDRLGKAGRSRLVRDETVVALLWPVEHPQESHSDPPSALLPMPGTRHVFSSLRPGTRLGLVRVAGEATDARGTAIPDGDYVVFYGVQPAFKDHLGTSPLRDFAVLLPARLDRGQDLDQRDLLTLIRVESSAHALVLRLLPEDSTDEADSCGSELALRASVRDQFFALTFDAGPTHE